MDLDNRPLQIAIVAPSLRILGGQSVQADRLLRAWADDPAVRAWLVPHNPVPPAPLRWATRIKYLRTVVTEAVYLPLLVRELRRADVVHLFSAAYTSFLLAPLPAFLVARLLGKPVVMNYHSGEAPDHLRRSALARWTLRTADRNAVPSRFLVDVLRQFGIAATAVPNLAALERFQFRARHPLRPRLLSTRNLEPIYNVACTLRAFRLVQDRHPDASLTLVGTGREEEPLKALAARLGVRHVTFVGQVAQAAIADYYADHDIYIQSPAIDNMPLSVLEAFASGLPVVSTNVGGIPAILTHGRHGLLSPADDHAALAAHVIELLDDPERARALAAAAHATLDNYAWPSVRAGWMSMYRSLLPRRTPAGATVEA